MGIAEFSIRNRLICGVVIAISLVGGLLAYRSMPRFEDPEFTIRIAQVITQYPGATPLEVANEVTETLETAFQELGEVKEIRSSSEAGVSTISVEILFEQSKTKDDLQIVYTKLRNKARDAARKLPPGASEPFVNDDYADVFGLYYLLTSDGFSPREMYDYAKLLRTRILTVDGVAKVGIEGRREEAIYVEISQEQVATTGVNIDQIFAQLSKHTSVVAAGDVQMAGRRLTLQLPETTETVSALENTVITTGKQDRIIRLKDVANVIRGYEDPPTKIMRYNGRPALAVGVSARSGENVVRIGKDMKVLLDELETERPIGLELHSFYHQGDAVEFSVKDFAKNVFMALAIVLVTLGIFMGLASAAVIGGVLVLTIAATLFVMDLMGVPMHRISLGALIIALGMLVDNAIVVTDGILVGVKAGKRKVEMAIDVVARTKWPLLGGTAVGIIAFAPIGFAPGASAEFTGDLFWVVMISLSFSWIFALTAVPLFADFLFREEKGPVEAKPDGAFLQYYKRLMGILLRLRWMVIGGAAALFFAAISAFGLVKPGFFPATTLTQIVVDFHLPQGMDIWETDRILSKLEAEAAAMDGVTDVHTIVGAGTLRYMLVYAPEDRTASYGQLLLKVENFERMATLIPELQTHVDSEYPDAQAKVWRFQMGPGGGAKIQAEFSGPDPVVLRELSAQAKAIMAANPNTISIKDDWRQPTAVIEPVINEARARRLGITREDIANATNIAFSGRRVGVFREDENLIPIIHRAPERERVGVGLIGSIQVPSQVTGSSVPLDQLTDGYRTVWQEGKYRRLNRVWTIQAQTDPAEGILAGNLLNEIRPDIEAIELPPGYSLTWEGEYGNSQKANAELASVIPIGLLAMVLTVVLLFNALRQPILIFLTVPLALIGVVFGLVVTGLPFEFMAILGVLSLSGLLIKNAIVLVDQMDLEIAEGKARFDAVVDSAASRVRPVMMGSLTTVLGVIPLFGDAFFKSMAVVLVFGLSFATILTLVVVPALYVVFFRIRADEVSVQAETTQA